MKTLQIGLEWMTERAGGLPRYYADLYRHSHGNFDFRGLVVGGAGVSEETAGEVIGFAPRSDHFFLRLWKARKAIELELLSSPPDLVATHFAAFTNPALGLIDRPLVLHFHGPWADEGNIEGNHSLKYLLKRQIERRVYGRSSLAVVLSKAFGAVLHQQFGVPWERIRVIPGGVDVKRFDIDLTRIQSRHALGWPQDRPIILSVRRLVHRMGLENLVDAIKILVRSQPDILVLIAGRGHLGADLQRRIDTLGLTRNVQLLGYVSERDLPIVYRAADVSIVPTQALEGFGLIALESLAAGTPVIVSPVGGLPEVVGDLSQDLILQSVAPEEIAERLKRAVVQRDVPNAITCLDYARRFDWPQIAKLIGDAYKEVL